MIYLASSWRNEMQPEVLLALRTEGHSVYDFRNPTKSWSADTIGDDSGGFQWSAIDPQWEDWTPWAYRQALQTSVASQGYQYDFEAMEVSDIAVLLLPSGRSAHIEAGYFAGHPDKQLHILVPDELRPRDKWEPELMYKLADEVHGSVTSLVRAL